MSREKEILESFSKVLHLDANTKSCALDLFTQYSLKCPQKMNELEMSTALRCSILVASKCQVYPTIDNQSTVRGCGLTVTQFLRGPPPITIDSFIGKLKGFIQIVDIGKETRSELQQIINNFAFSLCIFSKYEELLNKLDLRLRDQAENPKHDIREELKNMAWLIFILRRATLEEKKNDIVECGCLLISTLFIIIRYLPTNLVSGYFQELASNPLSHTARKSLGENPTDEEIEQENAEDKSILMEISKILKANTMTTVENQLTSLCELLKSLKEREVIEGNDKLPHSFLGIFTHERILKNIKKLEMEYEHEGWEELDERVFTTGEHRVGTPMKMIYRGRGNMIQPNSQGSGGKLESKRFLNYDNIQTPLQAHPSSNIPSTKLQDLELKSMTNSPYPMTWKTPITSAMEMHNWLLETITRLDLEDNGFTKTANRFYTSCTSGDGEIIREQNMLLVNPYLDHLQHALSNSRGKTHSAPKYRAQISKLYFLTLDELLLSEEKLLRTSDFSEILKNKVFHKSLIVACTETVLFVHNIIQLNFEQILQICELSGFEFWKIIAWFIKFDPTMISQLRQHFHEIEIKILSHLSWEKKSPLHEIISNIVEKEGEAHSTSLFKRITESSTSTPSIQPGTPKLNEKENESETEDKENLQAPKQVPPHELFFKRVLHLVAQRILGLSIELGISEEIREIIWEVMKYSLSNEVGMLKERHLDQIILCTIYAVCRMKSGMDLSFNKIITQYIDMYCKGAHGLHIIFKSVKLNDTENVDIIKFYNNFYIPLMKEAIMSICKGSNLSTKQRAGKIAVLAPQSPLRANIGPPILRHGACSSQSNNRIQRSPLGCPINQPMLTPRTKALYAFGESPSHELDNINSTIQGKPPGLGTGDGAKHYKDKLIQKIKGTAGRSAGAEPAHTLDLKNSPTICKLEDKFNKSEAESERFNSLQREASFCLQGTIPIPEVPRMMVGITECAKEEGSEEKDNLDSPDPQTPKFEQSSTMPSFKGEGIQSQEGESQTLILNKIIDSIQKYIKFLLFDFVKVSSLFYIFHFCLYLIIIHAQYQLFLTYLIVSQDFTLKYILFRLYISME